MHRLLKNRPGLCFAVNRISPIPNNDERFLTSFKNGAILQTVLNRVSAAELFAVVK